MRSLPSSDYAGNRVAWFHLAFSPAVIGDLQAVEPSLAQRLFDKTKWLASNVDNLRYEPLASDLPGIAKYAVGEWRIFYTVDREEHVLLVQAILSNRVFER